jgi:2-keto-4-pentenoate hydratase/2-oxohepta-3-ene-1,7-dioic acid hydratase in catechol pathway
MDLLHFIDPQSVANHPRVGVRTGSGILDLARAVNAASFPSAVDAPGSLAELFGEGRRGMERLHHFVEDAVADPQSGWFLDETTIQYAPPVLRPQKIICVGLNYRRHAQEAGMALPETPVLFAKFANALAAHQEPVPLPPTAVRYDYEVELGVVIGRRTRDVSTEEALDCVFGYCVTNDFSARDLQMRTGQWLLGKTLDKFLPVGPYLVTADQVPDPQDLDLHTWVNGELRQDSNTSDMLFSVAEIISYISRYMTLEPGDLISTGTPEGVILGMAEPVWLKPGDEVTVEVQGVGRLTSPLIGIENA